MHRFITTRNVSILLGLIGSTLTVLNYAPSQPSLPVVALVFVGCVLFWAWLASLAIAFALWLQSEVILMGRWPRVQWRPTLFNVCKLVAKLIGVAIPFVVFRAEGWAVLANPEHWALMPVTLGICMGVVAIPLWIAIKVGSSKLKRLTS